MSSRAPVDVVVVGGGIVGCAVAAYLGEAGLRVLLVESAGLASGASGANSGVIQHPADPALAALYTETLRLYAQLSGEAAGFQLPSEPAGLLFLSRSAAAVEQLAGSLGVAFPELEPELVSGAALRRLEPALHPSLAACRVPMGYPVPPAASTYAFATLAERHGVELRLGQAARLELAGERVRGVSLDGSLVPAEHVVVAAGPWTPEVVDPSGRWRPIQRRWGVVVEVQMAEPPRHVLEEAEIGAVLAGGAGQDGGDGALLDPAGTGPGSTGGGDGGGRPGEIGGGPEPVPSAFSLATAGGVIGVGSTFLPYEPDPRAWTLPLLRRGSSFVPAIADAPIRGVRACARPLSLDGRPLLGRVPGIEGLWVCAGHGPWGISTGPASARLVAAQLLGGSVTIPAALDAGRFGTPREV